MRIKVFDKDWYDNKATKAIAKYLIAREPPPRGIKVWFSFVQINDKKYALQLFITELKEFPWEEDEEVEE